jgi:hypothetical protein
VILRNDVEEDCEAYLLRPLVGIVTLFFLLFEATWNFTHFPPEPSMFNYGGYESHLPCCWQVRKCRGLDPDDYELFTCKWATNQVSGQDMERGRPPSRARSRAHGRKWLLVEGAPTSRHRPRHSNKQLRADGSYFSRNTGCDELKAYASWYRNRTSAE